MKNKNYLRSLGNNIKNRREEMNMCQQELADATKLTSITIDQIEKGEFAASVLILYNVGLALEANLLGLLEF